MTMPMALVRSYSAMLPRIEADEQLAAIETLVLGFGRIEPKDGMRRIRDLERLALGSRRRPRAKASAEQLAAMGIGVRIAEG